MVEAVLGAGGLKCWRETGRREEIGHAVHALGMPLFRPGTQERRGRSVICRDVLALARQHAPGGVAVVERPAAGLPLARLAFRVVWSTRRSGGL